MKWIHLIRYFFKNLSSHPVLISFCTTPYYLIFILEKWISNQNKEYLLPIICNYKKAIVHILKLKKSKENSSTDSNYESYLGLLMVFLRILNRINGNNNCIVSYETFYIPEIVEYFDLSDDYIRWIIAKSRGYEASEFHICNFPFVFDAGAKTVLLQVLKIQQKYSKIPN